MGAAALPIGMAVAGPLLDKFLGGGQQQATTTQQMPPHITAGQEWAINRGQQLGDRPYNPYEGQRFQGFNPMQENAFASSNAFGQMGLGALGHGYNSLMDMTGAGMMGDAYAGLMGLANNPNQGRAYDAYAANAGTAREAEAALANRDAIQNVDGGSFLGMDRNAYTNQYTDSVIQNTTDEMERGRQAQLQQGASAANAAGAFGGSRHGVQDALTNEGFFRQQGNMANVMNAQAFDAASGLMGQDLSRGLQANLANQGMDWNAQNLNAQLGTQSNQFNAGQANQMRQYNAGLSQQAALQNAQNRTNMSQFNVGSQLQALMGAGNLGGNMANFGLNQGNALSNFGIQGLGHQLAAGNQMQGFGQAQRDFDYGQYQEARDWMANNSQYMNNALNSSQGGGTTTQDMFGPSYLQQGVGWGAIGQGINQMGQDSGWWGGNNVPPPVPSGNAYAGGFSL